MEGATTLIWLLILVILAWIGKHNMLLGLWGVLVGLVVLSSAGSILYAIGLAVLRTFR